MNTVFKLLSLCSIVIYVACSVESVTEEPFNDKECLSQVLSSNQQEVPCFNVTPTMLEKYLKLVCKGKQVGKIVPIIKKGETLAYYVEFSNNLGWNLIAADTRVTPVLSESPTGYLVFQDEGPVNGILGTLKNVIDIKSNSKANVQAIWKFLYPELYHQVETKGLTRITRGTATGMWMPVDTVFAYDTVFSGRTLATKWGQDEPWNAYIPLDKKEDWVNWVHCPVGCVPVAVGQILYRYLYLTNGLYPIPDAVDMTSGTPQFLTFTTDWSGMALDNSETNVNAKNKTAKFLSWLGDSMGTDYQLDSSETSESAARNLLHNYLLFDRSTSYNYQTIFSNVSSNIPVCIFARDTACIDDGHAFIVDAYKTIKYQVVVRYVFDPEHEVTDDEFFNYPDWMFEWPGPAFNYDPITGNAEQSVAIDIVDNTYFLMNWGYDGDCDDVTYLARAKQYYYNEDFSSLYYVTEGYSSMSWETDNYNYTVFDSMLYNFRRKN